MNSKIVVRIYIYIYLTLVPFNKQLHHRVCLLCHQHLCWGAQRYHFALSVVVSSVSVGISVVVTLCFRTVSQKWLDGLNLNLACGFN